jgi:hypothetical protein
MGGTLRCGTQEEKTRFGITTSRTTISRTILSHLECANFIFKNFGVRTSTRTRNNSFTSQAGVPP